jgi:N-acetyl-gamma-glutamyl-phosphate reductase
MLECAAMSTPRIFIDGHAGTTGLRIRDWLADRDDVELITLNEDDRKADAARRNAIGESDLAILCLPDDAARVAATWGAETGTRILDTSSSHRVANGWVYGLPELVPGHRNKIQDAERVTNPGCYSSSFILLVRPLIDAGLLPANVAMSVHALSGYSGGGKSLIERWESTDTGLQGHLFEAPYAVDRVHKHIPEMQRYSGLLKAPQFVPAVGPFVCGMRIQVPIHQSLLASGVTGKSVWSALSERYRDEPFVEVAPFPNENSIDEWSLDPTALNDTNQIRLHVFPNPAGHLLLVGLLDNLGKGASGVAIQSLNLMLGLKEGIGLQR